MSVCEVKEIEKIFGKSAVKLQIHGFLNPNTAGNELVFRIDVSVSGSETKTLLFNSEGKQLDSGFQVCREEECVSVPEEYMDWILKELAAYKENCRKKV